MKAIKLNFYICLFAILAACFLINPAKAAISNGMNATDLLGQFDDVNGTVLNYNRGGENNGPGAIGFRPEDAAIDTVNHRLFVVDFFSNRVLVFNLNADNTIPDYVADNVLGQPDFNSRAQATTQSGMSWPIGLAYDSVNNRLFVASYNNNRVLVFDVNAITNGENAINVLGQGNFTSSGAATSQNGLSIPRDLAYDETNQRLFVADSENNRVIVFDVNAITNGENAIKVLGQANFTSGGMATTQSRMDYPVGLAYDATNNRLFVAEARNHRVSVFDVTAITDGENAINVLGQADFTSAVGALTQSGMQNPGGLAFDEAGNRLFVTGRDSCRVLVFDVTAITNGENAINVLGQSDFISGMPATSQSRLGNPNGLSYNPGNKILFVADTDNNRLMVFDVNAITDGENAVDVLGQRDLPSMAANYTNSGVNNGVKKQGFDGPSGIALDTVNHRLYVNDYYNNRVLVFNLDVNNNLIDRLPDNVLGQADFSSNSSDSTQSTMNGPRGLVVDSGNNRLFVADNLNHRVLVYDVTAITDGENAVNVLGQTNFTNNTSATTQSRMNAPYGLAYDSANQRLFVTTAGSNRVLIYDVNAITDGENAINVLGQTNFTNSGSALNQSRMNNPKGAAYDAARQYLFVSDADNTRVLVFDVVAITNGENAVNVLGQVNYTSNGTATTQSGMWDPNLSAYDATNKRLFVAENDTNMRVLVFQTGTVTNGQNAVNVLGQANFTSNVMATTQAGMGKASGVCYDVGNGKLYISDFDNNRVLIFGGAQPPPGTFSPTMFFGGF